MHALRDNARRLGFTALCAPIRGRLAYSEDRLRID
jgi:hypothetical protein